MDMSTFLTSAPKFNSRMSLSSSRSAKSDKDQEKVFVLPKITASAFAVVLGNAVDSLIILGKAMDLPRVSVDLEYKSIPKKYGEDYHEHIYDPETLETCQEGLEKKSKLKFHKDRTFLEKILREIYIELITDNSFDKIHRRIADFEKTIDEENIFLIRGREFQMETQSFQKTIDNDMSSVIRNIQITTENIGSLKDEYQKIAFENEVKMSYIKKWELSRYECNTTQLDVKEDNYNEIIREKNNSIDREARIHAEIERFLSEVTREYESSRLRWINTYETKMEKYQMDIQILKQKREEQMEEMKALSEEYNRRTAAINDYLEIREQRKKEQQELDRKQQAATKIQAWWRGVMVRKCLGPYRKKKGKKGANKGSKKTKKK